MSNNTSDRGRVLIVDDDRKILDLLVELLQLEGYEIATAIDGSQALDLAISFDPDVVVSDVVMPEVGGLELCRRLKDDPRTVRTTGCGGDPDIARSIPEATLDTARGSHQAPCRGSRPSATSPRVGALICRVPPVQVTRTRWTAVAHHLT